MCRPRDRQGPERKGTVVFDISFVLLTWNSRTYLRRCLDSVIAECASEGLRFEFVLVDNGSSDGSPDIAREYSARHGDSVRLIALDRNRGTTYPRNLALKTVQSPVVCVLDSDTEYLTGSIRGVIDLLAANASLGIVAPRLLLPDGSVQHSVKRFPTLLDKLRKVPRLLTGRKATRNDFYDSFPFERRTLVETAIAACWFLRADLLGQAGLLDEGIFYSPEDLDYCARVRDAGKQVLYDPGVMFLHHTQQITHRRPLSRMSLSHLKGLIRFHRRHGGWFVRRPGGPVPWPAANDASGLPLPDPNAATRS
jgi:GT2 family glycosyltransferase